MKKLSDFSRIPFGITPTPLYKLENISREVGQNIYSRGDDMIGVAVTAADPKPFHSMAAHKEKGAKAAIRLLQNANQVSSVCNDVVGDICGIVSGSTAAVIVTHLQRDLSTTSVLISIGATALISGITIGGKALGKTVAINQCTSVVYRVARIMHALHLSR